ncbi:NnrU family protein [Phaeovulum sp.]|uniref:NnrU family protein n=1 Tax=Phaeovulum sp. TaxID=2934796 RepID=UPI0039E6DC38
MNLGGWGEYLLAFAAFLGSHAIPSRPGLKAWLMAHLGRKGYVTVFSLLSTALLFWLIFAAGRAPYVELWGWAHWQIWLVNLTMPVVVVLSVFGIGTPNPLSFGGRSNGFDPEHPGIAGVVRHPLLWALLLWSLAHLIANGDLAHALLFGGFAAFSVMGMKLIDRRHTRVWGAEEFMKMTARTSTLPFAAWISGRWHPQQGPSIFRLLISVAVWLALLLLHPSVIGVSPLP